MNTMGMKQKLKTMYPKSENWARKVVDTWTLISDPNIWIRYKRPCIYNFTSPILRFGVHRF